MSHSIGPTIMEHCNVVYEILLQKTSTHFLRPQKPQCNQYPILKCFISDFMCNNKSTPNANMNYKFVFSPIIPLVRKKIAKRNMPKLSVLLMFELVVAHLLRIMTLGFPSARKCQCAFNLL